MLPDFTRNHLRKMLVNKMLDFTYGGKVQLKLIFIDVFFKIQLFERFLTILSSCPYCFYPVVLEKPCMFPV